ncbi:ABC transporter substrate-binding protein [Thermomonospora catenispora]|uniref:ABC transporter substrate-binding protein n=1 Tax=Thermomonospora catenispora TaxID=2493090 RepID=UPI00111E5D72|nr:ABC transporter substrate-binding protein [Thermomonospora catenispora]TNY35491.1 sugar ABC transporter substrate-binding protein [Thermomonospora catenispora]
MKRTLPLRAAAAIGVAALALTACGSGDGGPGGDRKRIVYVPAVTGIPFYNTVACGAKHKAKELGVTLDVQGPPEFDPAKQSAIVNALVGDRPDAIMISVADAKALIPPLKLAKDAGIKIIGIDGDVDDRSIMTTNIISNNVQGGRLAAAEMAKLTGGKGEIMGLNNDPGNPLGEAREQGFVDELKKYPGMKYIGTQYSKNETAKAASIASSASSSNPRLAGIYAMSTTNSEGAVTGLRESGRTGKVKLVGFDISGPIENALRARQMDGTIVQHPYREGEMGVQSAMDALAGKPVPRDQSADFVFATPDNLDTPKVQQYVYKTECAE